MNYEQLKKAEDEIRKEFVKAFNTIDKKMTEEKFREDMSVAAKQIGIMKQELVKAGFTEDEAVQMVMTLIQMGANK